MRGARQEVLLARLLGYKLQALTRVAPMSPELTSFLRNSALLGSFVALAHTSEVQPALPVFVLIVARSIVHAISRTFGPVQIRAVKLSTVNRRRWTTKRIVMRLWRNLCRREHETEINMGRRQSDRCLGFQLVLLGSIVIEYTWSNVPVIKPDL